MLGRAIWKKNFQSIAKGNKKRSFGKKRLERWGDREKDT